MSDLVQILLPVNSSIHLTPSITETGGGRGGGMDLWWEPELPVRKHVEEKYVELYTCLACFERLISSQNPGTP